MQKLKEDFKKVLGKHKITRQDLIPIKNHANKINPELSNALAHILEGTSCEINKDKVEKLNKLYQNLFK